MGKPLNDAKEDLGLPGIDTMIDALCESVYKMATDIERNFYELRRPEIVMLCSPKTFWEIRGYIGDRVFYKRNTKEYNIPILTVIGINIPVILKNDMPQNIEFSLMYRKEYERLEKEEQYKKFMEMWDINV